MSDGLTFTVGSDPNEDDLVVDLFYDDEAWGAITRRGDHYVLDLYPKSDGHWSFAVDEALSILTEAYERLRSFEVTDWSSRDK